MSQGVENLEKEVPYFTSKVEGGKFSEEAERNLLGFFNVLIEIDKQQRNDNDNRGSGPSN